MNKLSKILTLWDGIWSVPLSFTAFLAFEELGRLVFGAGLAPMIRLYFRRPS